MGILSYNLHSPAAVKNTLAFPTTKTISTLQTVDVLTRSADHQTDLSKDIPDNRKIVSYNPARNRTLAEQAAAIEKEKRQRDLGVISRQEYLQRRREILGL